MSIQDNTSRGLIKVDEFSCSRENLPIKPIVVPEGGNYIEILTSGVIYFNDGISQKKYTAGAMFWHTGGEETIHDTVPSDPYRCFAFHLMGYEPSRLVPRVTSWLPLDSVNSFGRECLEAFHSSDTNKLYLADYVYSTLLYRATTPKAAIIKYPRALTLAMELIDSRLFEGVNVDEIARSISISRPYLFALFRDYLKCSPYQYMLSQRINHAKAMLCSENHSIKEIAFKCNFNSLEVFYRQFRKCTGVTPAEYRSIYR